MQMRMCGAPEIPRLFFFSSYYKVNPIGDTGIPSDSSGWPKLTMKHSNTDTLAWWRGIHREKLCIINLIIQEFNTTNNFLQDLLPYKETWYRNRIEKWKLLRYTSNMEIMYLQNKLRQNWYAISDSYNPYKTKQKKKLSWVKKNWRSCRTTQQHFQITNIQDLEELNLTPYSRKNKFIHHPIRGNRW